VACCTEQGEGRQGEVALGGQADLPARDGRDCLTGGEDSVAGDTNVTVPDQSTDCQT